MKNSIVSILFLSVVLHVSSVVFADELPKLTVYKSPTCGCCTAWVDYMRNSGFDVESVDRKDMHPIKQQYGVSPALQSCHTALVDGYVIEGHVPAADVKKLLEEKPDITGLTAPGMPALSPGMGSLIPKDYNVYSFDKDGNTGVYSQY